MANDLGPASRHSGSLEPLGRIEFVAVVATAKRSQAISADAFDGG